MQLYDLSSFTWDFIFSVLVGLTLSCYEIVKICLIIYGVDDLWILFSIFVKERVK